MIIKKEKLGNIAEIVSGSTPDTTKKEFWDGEINWVTPKDLSGLQSAYLHTTPRKITQAGLQSCSSRMLPAGSVLFSSRAPIGHVAINTVPMCSNQGFKSFVPDSTKVFYKYLYYWLKANRLMLENLGNGATFKEVSKAIISNVEIPLPPLEEQKRIAAVLDKADEVRAKRRAALEKLDSLLQSVFLDMFGDPVSNPKGFEIQEIGELIKVKSGNFLPEKSFGIDGKIPVYGGNGISGFHDEHMFDNSKIVIGRVGVYCGAVHVSQKYSWITDNALFVAEQSEMLQDVYLAAALKQANLNQYAGRFAQPLISGSRIYPIKIIVPPLKSQDKYTATVEKLNVIRTKLNTAGSEKENLFQSLQQRAFAGELFGAELSKTVENVN